MREKISDDEIDFINSLDDEFSLLTVPYGYDVIFDDKVGIILKKQKSSRKGNITLVAG
ncbi:MAG: hypothetical protein NTV63_04360 [Candidatus Woesearchaeota archaeon]|nr:hypothetical protein [Candidatus Woesearchaeota archaeon]